MGLFAVDYVHGREVPSLALFATLRAVFSTISGRLKGAEAFELRVPMLSMRFRA